MLVRAASGAGILDLSVEDEGPGVPEKDSEAIFMPFFSTKELAVLP